MYGASKWVSVGEDGGSVDITVPLPLSNGAVLDAAIHLGQDLDTPPVTVGLAPSGVSGAGAVAIGGLEFDPVPLRSRAASHQPGLSERRLGPVQVVPLRLPPEARNGLESAAAAAAVREATDEWLRPRLLTERKRLREAGVQLVVGCDTQARVVLWVSLDDTHQFEPTVAMTAEGQLRTELVLGAVDLVVDPGQDSGLAVSLHLKEFQESSQTALLMWSAQGPVEMGAHKATRVEAVPEETGASSVRVGDAASQSGAGDGTRPAARTTARRPRSKEGTLAAMACWQYAQLTITVDGRALAENTRTVVWHGPGQGSGENYSDTDQTALELLNRFGADGWELAGLQDYREGGDSSSYEAARLTTIYTFKRPVGGEGPLATGGSAL